MPLISVVMGSSSDWETLQHAVTVLLDFGVQHEVQVVSADVMTDPRSGIQFYTLRVTIPASETGKIKNLKLFPGMQCTVMVKTGERSFLSYLLRPILRRFTTALSEG